MAKGQKALAKQMELDRQQRATQYEESRKEAKTPSYAESQREGELKAHNEYKAKKDYRKPPPGLISLNYADPAQRQRMRERMLNATPTGTAAWGAEGNPTALALSRQNMQDTFDRDAASQYEGDLRAEDTYQRTGAADSLIAADWARKAGLLSNDASMLQFATQARIQTQPKSILPALLSAGLAGAGMVLGGPAGAAAGQAVGGAVGGGGTWGPAGYGGT
jgi:hypothetical protein